MAASEFAPRLRNHMPADAGSGDRRHIPTWTLSLLSQMLLAGRHWIWLVLRRTGSSVWCPGSPMTHFFWTGSLRNLLVCLLQCTWSTWRSLCLRPLQSLLVVPGVPMNGNGFSDLCALIIAGDNPDPHLQQKEHEINPELFRPHSGTHLKRL